ncbi:MAG: AHH domain-containing protein [Ferruginibacter sp.]
MGLAARKDAKVYCTFCKKKVIHNPDFLGIGTHVGNGEALGNAIMKSKYGNKPIREHPLSMPKGRGYCAQAHHLICSESMDNRDWARICKNFGYNINHKRNGIILPADMKVACQEKVPLHKGNHEDTLTHIKRVNYVQAVKRKIDPILDDAKQQEYCKKQKDIIARLNKTSKSIWLKLESFKWTITYDGKHYSPGSRKGCLNARGLTRKRKIEARQKKCKDDRDHQININVKGKYFKEQ